MGKILFDYSLLFYLYGGQNMIKLIASDLDGTLLQNGAQELDPLIFDQIRE